MDFDIVDVINKLIKEKTGFIVKTTDGEIIEEQVQSAEYTNDGLVLLTLG